MLLNNRDLYGRVLLGALAIACVEASYVSALTVTPGRTEIRLSPGESHGAVLTVANEIKEELQVEVSKKDWFVLPENKDFKVDRWLQVRGPQKFTLKPGQSRTIPIKVTCPKGAQGELVGMVSFEYLTDNPGMITPMISVSTYLAIAGTEKVAGEIVELGVHRWREKLQAAVAIKSTGNVHLRPTGTLTLTDDKGKEVARFQVPVGEPAYPGQVRGYLGQGPDITLGSGHYTLNADLTYQDLHLTGSRGFSVASDGQIQMDKVK